MIADIAVIDMDNYSYSRSEDIDFSKPQLLANGVEYVIVNGKNCVRKWRDYWE